MSEWKMKRLALVILIVTGACVSTAAFAQKEAEEQIREIENSNRATQLEIEQSQLQWQQIRMWNESREAADRAEQVALEQAAAANRAEEEAEDLRDEIEQAAVRTRNNIYLVVLLFLTAGFVAYVIRKHKKGEIMQENQKFGILAIIGSTLVILLAIVISDKWIYKFDFLQNLMSTLRIQLFAEEYVYPPVYLIDVPTKYVVLACVSVAAYGLTTYLGITPIPKKKAGKIQGTSTDVEL